MWFSGVTATDTKTCCTDTDAEPETLAVVAVMFVDPAPLAVTSPVLLTVATELFDETQLKVRPEMAVPSDCLALALSCAVSPSEVALTLAGVTTTDATVGGGGGVGGGSVGSSPQAQMSTVGKVSHTPTLCLNRLHMSPSLTIVSFHDCSGIGLHVHSRLEIPLYLNTLQHRDTPSPVRQMECGFAWQKNDTTCIISVTAFDQTTCILAPRLG